jgi:phosphoribosylformimino-5-aminoimidazole carboxamide ribotide isomerase
MILIPAIDIKGGIVVRLFQGDFSQETDYDPDPTAVADKWFGMGARWLHLVDLDGAKTGTMHNKDFIVSITQKFFNKASIEVGGGIRDEQTVEELIAAGVKRVILGTKAIEDKAFLKKMLDLYREKICVSLDCSIGIVLDHGWVSLTKVRDTDLVPELEDMGLQWMIYTDVGRDGTLQGPNFDQLRLILNKTKTMNVIASGGVSSLQDVLKLRDLTTHLGRKLSGAITGKAIYEKKLDLKKAIELLNA